MRFLSLTRYCLVLATVLLTMGFFAQGAAASFIVQAPNALGLSRGLVGYWSFDGKAMAGNRAFDMSGQGNYGTLTGSNGLPVRAIGKIGQGMQFDGVDDYVDAGSGSSLDLEGAMTACAWIYARSIPNATEAVIVTNQTGGASTVHGQYSLEIENDLSLGFFWTEDGGNGIRSLTSTATISKNTWQHYCAVRNSTTAGTLYLNGAAQTTSVSGGSIEADLFESTKIGRSTNSAGSAAGFWDGLLDDVRIYNRALSVDEIKRLYKIGGTVKLNTTLEGPKSGLVGWWSFDGKAMAGNRAFDMSGQGNYGTLTGSNGLPVRTIGKIGQGLSFDGVDDHVALGSPASLGNITRKTISAWIYPRTLGGSNFGTVILSLDEVGPSPAWYIQLCSNDGTECPSTANTFVFLSQDIGVANSRGEWAAPANTITLNQWQHIAITYDCSAASNDAVMYYNGTQVAATKTQTPNVSPCDDDSSVTKFIGRDGTSGTSQFNGTIDDVRMYNRALSADEIKRLYNSGR